MDSETAFKDLKCIAQTLKLIDEQATPANWRERIPGQWSFAQTADHLAQTMEFIVGRFSFAFASPEDRRTMSLVDKVRWLKVRLTGKLCWECRLKEVQPADEPGRDNVMQRLMKAHDDLADLIAKFPEPRIQHTFVRHPKFGDLILPEWIGWLKIMAAKYQLRLNEVLRLSPYRPVR